MHHRAVARNRADIHKNIDTDRTQTHGCTRFRHSMDLCGRRQVQALLPLRKRLQLQTSQAVRRFLERLASLLLVGLLET